MHGGAAEQWSSTGAAAGGVKAAGDSTTGDWFEIMMVHFY